MSMTEVSTLRFGKISVEDRDMLHFDQGIPGFFHLREWFLVGEDDNPIKWLQSAGDEAVALPVAMSQSVRADYNARIAEGDLGDLVSEGEEELCAFVVVNVPPGAPWNSTANLRAPIIINTRTRQGRQVVSLNEDYSMRAPLFSEEVRQALVAQIAKAEVSERPVEEE